MKAWVLPDVCLNMATRRNVSAVTRIEPPIYHTIGSHSTDEKVNLGLKCYFGTSFPQVMEFNNKNFLEQIMTPYTLEMFQFIW
jgi:hypothetical protein